VEGRHVACLSNSDLDPVHRMLPKRPETFCIAAGQSMSQSPALQGAQLPAEEAQLPADGEALREAIPPLFFPRAGPAPQLCFAGVSDCEAPAPACSRRRTLAVGVKIVRQWIIRRIDGPAVLRVRVQVLPLRWAEVSLGVPRPEEYGEHSRVVPVVHECCDTCGGPFDSPESALLMIRADFCPGTPAEPLAHRIVRLGPSGADPVTSSRAATVGPREQASQLNWVAASEIDV
jgi:hypothetical protein